MPAKADEPAESRWHCCKKKAAPGEEPLLGRELIYEYRL